MVPSQKSAAGFFNLGTNIFSSINKKYEDKSMDSCINHVSPPIKKQQPTLDYFQCYYFDVSAFGPTTELEKEWMD